MRFHFVDYKHPAIEKCNQFWIDDLENKANTDTLQEDLLKIFKDVKEINSTSK